MIQGYLQLLEETDLSEKQKEYLEILGLAKKLEEIEETDWVGERDVGKNLKAVLEDISNLTDREGVKIEENYPEPLSHVRGDYSINLIFSQILLTRTQTSECGKIRITAKEREEEILVRIEDNGKPLPKDVREMFTGRPYTGETTGVGGVRYYMVRQIAEHNNVEIEIKDSELGGARFDIHLKKANKTN